MQTRPVCIIQLVVCKVSKIQDTLGDQELYFDSALFQNYLVFTISNGSERWFQQITYIF